MWINMHSQFFSDLQVYLVALQIIFNDQLLFSSLILKRWKTKVKECRYFWSLVVAGDGPDIRKC